MYCITHELSNVSENKVCLFASCPPPELEENWQDNLIEPSLLELHIMDLRSTELVTSWA